MGLCTIILSVIFILICIISFLVSTYQDDDIEAEKVMITAQEIFVSSLILLVIIVVADIIFS